MDLQPDEQQELLTQSLDRFLEKRLPFDVRQHQREAKDFLDFWAAMAAELGVGAAGLPEDVGGFGGGAEAEAIVAASLGRALAVTPYIPAMILSAHLLRGLGRADMVQSLVDGDQLIVTAVEEPQTRGDVKQIAAWADPVAGGWKLSGTKLAVDFAGQADIVLIPMRVSDGDFALFALGHEQIAPVMRSYRLIDDTPAADIALDGLKVPADSLIAQGPAVLPALRGAINRATAALCAEGAGLAQIMVQDTINYAREREQFGVPLSSFQALQHRMVDMWIKVQELDAAALLAALKVSDPAAVSAAKATMAEGLRLIGQEAVQLHGAMGLTEELRVGHYFKRATVLEHKMGSADRHVERYRATRLTG